MLSTGGGSASAERSLARQNSAAPSAVDARPGNVMEVPSGDPNSAISRIEGLLESLIDAINNGGEIVIPYQNARSRRNGPTTRSFRTNNHSVDAVRFPARTVQEVKKFEALFRIIELSHEALLSGKLLTKRNIYYQDPDLFRSQSVVDDMVDSLALTLGVGREDLNIVAAAKGLISGLIDLTLRDDSLHNCDIPGDTGMLLPSVASIQKINFRTTKWLLVIEKEATFRTLAASQYYRSSQAGHGIILTGKGFPDLATRRFLCIIQAIRPELATYALVDFDPHGVAIMRTYKYGSRRLDHEENVTAPRLRWLGLRSEDIFPIIVPDRNEKHSHEPSRQMSISRPNDGTQSERPVKKPRFRQGNGPSDSISSLTKRDRKKAFDLMKEVSATGSNTGDGLDQIRELQCMLMLNIKAEIQAVDNYGDIADWLDGKLGM